MDLADAGGMAPLVAGASIHRQPSGQTSRGTHSGLFPGICLGSEPVRRVGDLRGPSRRARRYLDLQPNDRRSHVVVNAHPPTSALSHAPARQARFWPRLSRLECHLACGAGGGSLDCAATTGNPLLGLVARAALDPPPALLSRLGAMPPWPAHAHPPVAHYWRMGSGTLWPAMAGGMLLGDGRLHQAVSGIPLRVLGPARSLEGRGSGIRDDCMPHRPDGDRVGDRCLSDLFPHGPA